MRSQLLRQMNCDADCQGQQQRFERIRVALDQPLAARHREEDRQALLDRQIVQHGVTDQGRRITGMLASWGVAAGGGTNPSR